MLLRQSSGEQRRSVRSPGLLRVALISTIPSQITRHFRKKVLDEQLGGFPVVRTSAHCAFLLVIEGTIQ